MRTPEPMGAYVIRNLTSGKVYVALLHASILDGRDIATI